MYDQLLAQLLAKPDKVLVIKEPTVTLSSVRRGLVRAFRKFNGQMELMGMEAVAGSVSVSNPAEGTRYVTIRIAVAPQVSDVFTIIEDSTNDQQS